MVNPFASDMQKYVMHFVQEFEYELKDASEKCMNVGSGFRKDNEEHVPALNQDVTVREDDRYTIRRPVNYHLDNDLIVHQGTLPRA